MPAVIPAVRAHVRPAALDVILRNRVRRARLPSAGTIWRLLIQCPKLKDVHVKGCRDMLIGAIRNQVLNEFAAVEPRLPCKRLADGSKRVHVPHFMIEQVCKTPSGLCSDQTKPNLQSVFLSHLRDRFFHCLQLEEQEKWGRPRKSQCTVHLNW